MYVFLRQPIINILRKPDFPHFALTLLLALCVAATSTHAKTTDNARIAPLSNAPSQDLPYAKGLSFPTLDEYLAYRKKLGASDRPYYEEISPGIYRLIKGRKPQVGDPKTFTRKQLMETFGFKK
jgi:hypothetical protein